MATLLQSNGSTPEETLRNKISEIKWKKIDILQTQQRNQKYDVTEPSNTTASNVNAEQFTRHFNKIFIQGSESQNDPVCTKRKIISKLAINVKVLSALIFQA